MTYAGGRRILDADSHLMELPDFLTRHAPAALRDRIPTLAEVGIATEGIRMREYRDRLGHPPEVVERLAALGDGLTKGPKWHDALGAFNTAERSTALSLLGFERQVVFSSFCGTRIFGETDLDLAYAAAGAHNRAMAEFCDGEPRLMGVAMVPLTDPARALAEIDAALGLGLQSIWIASHAPGGRSPGHPDHEAIWATLEERRVPFLLHVGSSSLSIDDEWLNDGHSERQSARGRAEVIGSKDLSVIFHSAQRFISVLILDGVLEQFPGLRGGVIELGAGWVPDTLRRLDHAVDIWARSEPHLGEMQRKPSEQAREQLRFTPYAFENAGRLIEESAAELYLFSSDYPHAEGGRDPLGRFSRTLEGMDEGTLDRFFARNFLDLYPNACPDTRGSNP